MAAKKKGASKPKTDSKVWNNYEVNGKNLNRKNLFCPKCGVGVFMAQHKDRVVCGKCGYMEKK